jgi:hypothetical protein
VPNDTTPPANSGDANAQDTNWESRYTGLQKVLGKRDSELASATSALGTLREEHAKALAELDTYRQRDVDAAEEDVARQQYESLKARFDNEESPRPVGNNQQRQQPREEPDWLSATPSGGYASRERTGTGSGWPT